MEQVLRNYIKVCDKLDAVKYHDLLTLFGKELVHRELGCYLEEQIKNDFSFENQCCLWERFGYYLATLNTSVFEKQAILDVFLKDDLKLCRKERGGLSLEEEKKYGYHLLNRDYITICLDESKNKVDMIRVFASIRHVGVRDFILKRFFEMYQTISRVSDYDKEMKEFLRDYQKKCLEQELPELCYQGKLIDEEILLEQVDMYVRYSIAKDKFLQANQGLLYNNTSRCFDGKFDDDYLMEGYFGLLRAVEKFDVRKGIAFSTYATNGIKLAIWRYQKNCLRLIRLPVYLEELVQKMAQFDSQFYNKYGKFPTEQEVALELGISVKKVLELKKCLDQKNCTSLNKKIVKENGQGEALELIDVISDRVCIDDEVINKEYMKYIYDVIDDKLSDREKYILLERAKDRTLKEIGEEFHFTRERTRQIEAEALKKLLRVPGINRYNPFRR